MIPKACFAALLIGIVASPALAGRWNRCKWMPPVQDTTRMQMPLNQASPSPATSESRAIRLPQFKSESPDQFEEALLAYCRLSPSIDEVAAQLATSGAWFSHYPQSWGSIIVVHSLPSRAVHIKYDLTTR